jgi:hypothetical protein
LIFDFRGAFSSEIKHAGLSKNPAFPSGSAQFFGQNSGFTVSPPTELAEKNLHGAVAAPKFGAEI